MEIPDPVPEMTISIPKSGKVRLTSLEMADAWIAALCTAKDGMVAAQHAMGQCGTDDEDEPKLASDGRPGLAEPDGVPYPDEYAPDVVHDILTLAGPAVPLAVVEGWTWQQRRDAAEWANAEYLHASDNDVSWLPVPPHVAAAMPAQAADLPMCDAIAHDGSAAECARPDGHRPPHRSISGYEWGDVEPHHATETDALCPAYTDENGERWLCSAQAGHGGPDHIAYGPGGEVCHRWPVDGDARDATCEQDAKPEPAP